LIISFKNILFRVIIKFLIFYNKLWIKINYNNNMIIIIN
jgi:hypothetical protein